MGPRQGNTDSGSAEPDRQERCPALVRIVTRKHLSASPRAFRQANRMFRTGLASAVILIVLSPNGIFGKSGAIFPLENPGIVSIPLGFLGAWLGTILTKKDPESEAKFAELNFRAQTGLGSEKAGSGH